MNEQKLRCVAIVGATGAVGQEFGRVLAERKFPAGEYRLLASARSAGKTMEFAGRRLRLEELGRGSFDGVQIALFSAGASISREYGPLARKAGAVVIDNSSAFRMDAGVPLIVPEINPDALRGHQGIIAVPNCSTIILLMPLWPLHRVNPVRRIVVSTYQAVSGAGARAMDELRKQSAAVLAGRPAEPGVFAHACAFNVFSHNSAVGPDGYNGEESKVAAETHKILGDATIGVAATCMRVPTFRAHLESVSVEFARSFDERDARAILSDSPGVKLVDDRAANHFPMPVEAQERDEVLVGRVRHDPSVPDRRGLQFICCGDQLRKGAALNAVQIAELLVREGL